MPVIKTSDAMKNLDGGVVIEVISDDPAIELDLPAWCESHGHSVLRSEEKAGVWRIVVQKRADDAEGTPR